MENDKNIFERIFKLLTMIGTLIVKKARDPYEIADVLQAIVDNVHVMAVPVFFRRLYVENQDPIIVPPTLDLETFENCNLFKEVLGAPFPQSESSLISATSSTSSLVYEIIMNGYYLQMFGTLDSGRRRWKESQIVKFCRHHRNKLSTTGYTLFEAEHGFFARVYFDGVNDLRVFRGHTHDGQAWDTEKKKHRFISLG